MSFLVTRHLRFNKPFFLILIARLTIGVLANCLNVVLLTGFCMIFCSLDTLKPRFSYITTVSLSGTLGGLPNVTAYSLPLNVNIVLT